MAFAQNFCCIKAKNVLYWHCEHIKEVNAFYDWLETNSTAVSAIVLWHALMHICNKAGWPKDFTVAVLVLSAKTGLERRTIYNARNELKQKGRIDFKERKGNLSAIYSMLWFCDYGEYENCDFFNEIKDYPDYDIVAQSLYVCKDLKDEFWYNAAKDVFRTINITTEKKNRFIDACNKKGQVPSKVLWLLIWDYLQKADLDKKKG